MLSVAVVFIIAALYEKKEPPEGRLIAGISLPFLLLYGAHLVNMNKIMTV